MTIKLTLATLTFAAMACSNQNTEPAVQAGLVAQNTTSQMENQEKPIKSFYDFVVTDITGNTFSFNELKGKRVLVVNTASRCGYTPQYEQLEELYKEFGGEKFTIVGFPANNFGGQEPGSDEEIKAFCQKNYGVTFPMMSKISVTGEDQHSVYKWLTSKSLNGQMDAEVKWNFHKFLVDENGKLVASYPSGVSPLDEKIMEFVE